MVVQRGCRNSVGRSNNRFGSMARRILFLCTIVNVISQSTAVDCTGVTSCLDCLSREGCNGWTGGGGASSLSCLESCNLIADAACYAISDNTPTASQVCNQAATDAANDAICTSASSDCATCLNTLKSDGTPCDWYQNDDSDIRYCSNGCDWFMTPDTCGKSTCASYETARSCDLATTCLDCLEQDSCQGWSPTIGSCFSNCDKPTDISCYSTINLAGQILATPSEICTQADTEATNQALCSKSSSSCTTCVNTTMTNGQPCRWQPVDGSNGGVCLHQCGMIGCGETECPAASGASYLTPLWEGRGIWMVVIATTLSMTV